jgi:hypothetical protein
MWGGGTDLEVMRRLALEEPPRMDSVMPDAPGTLVELQARLVARDVEKRPANAAEVARELRAYATRWPAADGASVAAMMQRLFAAQIEQRRAELETALEAAAPARVAELRSTLDLSTGFERATLTEPLILRSETPPPVEQSAAPRRWRGVVGAAAVLALGAVVAAVALTRGDHARAPEGTAAAATTTTAAATMVSPSTNPAPPPSIASPAPFPPASSSPPPIGATPPPAVRPAKSAPARTVGRPPRPAPTPTGNRPPDVDPTPF